MDSRTPNDGRDAKNSIQQEIDIRKITIRHLLNLVADLEYEKQNLEASLPPPPCRIIGLPLEVLGEIFAFVIADVEDKFDIPVELLDLCLVCKRWREAALSAPRLWNELGVELEHQSAVDGLERWLSRSGTIRKSLEIRGPVEEGHKWRNCPLNNAALAKLLAQGTWSFDCLTLECGSTSLECLQRFVVDLLLPLKTNDPSPWDTIRSLKFGASFWKIDGRWFSPEVLGNFFLSFLPTNLVNLDLKMPAPFGPSVPSVLPPALNLATLNVLTLRGNCSMAWAMETLGSCASLTKLTIDLEGIGCLDTNPTHAQIPSAAKYTLPNVQSFRFIGLSSQGSEGHVLSHLKMPLLEDLDLSFENDIESELASPEYPDMLHFIDPLIAFVADSGRTDHIRRLRIHYLTVSSAGLRHLLLGFPSVVHLTMDSMLCSSAVFRHAQHAGEHLLPNLEELDVLYASGEFDPDELCSWLLKRQHLAKQGGEEYPRRALRRVALSLQRQEPNEIKSVQALMKSDLETPFTGVVVHG